MNAQLEAFTAGKQRLAEVIVRLLAVLAVLRELRGCDGRVAWVEKGQTTVPKDQRLRLLAGILESLFERTPFENDSSLLNMGPLGEEFTSSDDVARLKGLVLWLAWDCGLTLDLRRPFNETREELSERLRRNAWVLAFAQMIRTDELVIDEARQSIGSLTASEMRWLDDVRGLAEYCRRAPDEAASLQPAETAEPGDIAFHRSTKSWDLRVVSSNGVNQIALIRLTKGVEPVAYRPDRLAVVRLRPGADGGPIKIGRTGSREWGPPSDSKTQASAGTN